MQELSIRPKVPVSEIPYNRHGFDDEGGHYIWQKQTVYLWEGDQDANHRY